MFENSLNTSLRDTTMCGSSGVGSSEGTPSMDAHVRVLLCLNKWRKFVDRIPFTSLSVLLLYFDFLIFS